MPVNKRMIFKISPYICGLVAGTMVSQPIVAAYASAVEVNEVVKTKYSEEFKELFRKMEELLVELEGVENKYEAAKDEAYRLKIKELLPLFFEINKIDEKNEFLVNRKEGDLLDVLFKRTLNILYDIPMKYGHELVKEFAKELRDSYFSTRYNAYGDLLRLMIKQNPDSSLNGFFDEYLNQLNVFGTLGPDQPYDPDALPEINSPSVDLSDFDLKEELEAELDKTWDEYYEEEDITIDHSNSIGSSTASKDNVYYAPSTSERVTYNVSYDVVGNQCVKSKQKLVNGVASGVEAEIIPDNVAYEYCSTDYFFYLYEGFEDNEGQASSSETNQLTYNYNNEGEKDVRFSLDENKMTYKQLKGILDLITKDKGGEIASDKDKILYVLDGKPLIIYSYENEKTIEEVNEDVGKYVDLTFNFKTKENE